MHALMFGLKRAYWGSLKPTRKRLTKIGLTAARFDMLYVLRGGGPIAQSTIRRKLGVTAPVVSRMLKSLRELDLVSRQRSWSDRRDWLISLTQRGRMVIRRAIDAFIHSRRAHHIVERAICPMMPAGPARQEAALYAMDTIESLLNRLREGFRAGGTLYYPWHPDE
jgi:DNA-binding MarR family transcriptional regulator